LKIKVIEIGGTLFDADEEYQEPAIRAALEAGGDTASVITDYTDTDRSDISTDDYAVVHEDDGTLLWHGWLTGGRERPAPPQALEYLAGLGAASPYLVFIYVEQAESATSAGVEPALPTSRGLVSRLTDVLADQTKHDEMTGWRVVAVEAVEGA